MVIAVVGKTNSAKDTIAKYLKENYGVPAVVSYTTRPMRNYEVNGIQHYFVDDERMSEIVENDDIIAYTKNEMTGIQYCATVQALTADSVVYIINPDGIHWFNENGTNAVEMRSIYVYAEETDILNRGIRRGDNPEVLVKRLESERDEFDAFYENKEFDWVVYNTDTLEYLFSQVDFVMGQLGFYK